MNLDTFEHVAFLHKRMLALDTFCATMEDHERAMRFGISIDAETYAMLSEDFYKFISDNKQKILDEVKKL